MPAAANAAIVLTAGQIREAERVAMETVSESVLMARAADAVAAECEALLFSARGALRGARVVVLAGSGNNGGDALLAGARLHYRGAETTAILTSDSAHEMGVGECLAAGAAVHTAGDELEAATVAVANADLVIDGIVGIGAKPGLRPPADSLVASISPDAVVVSVDIPSGLDVDSGNAEAAHVRADVTVTFTALKPCLAQKPARASAGKIVVAQVGIPLPA